jgi:hypothetical protein
MDGWMDGWIVFWLYSVLGKLYKLSSLNRRPLELTLTMYYFVIF